MSEAVINGLGDVAFGAELPTFKPDVSLANVTTFVKAAEWDSPRFTDHQGARAQGFPAALVPGIMSQGFFSAMIHRWAPAAELRSMDTIFRAPVLVDQPCAIKGVVTDINDDEGLVEIDVTLVNEKHETRVFGTARVFLPS